MMKMIMMMKMNCPKCGWGWEARVDAPASCPRCKQYLRKGREFQSVKVIHEIVENAKKVIARPVQGTNEFKAFRQYMLEKNDAPSVEELKKYMEGEWQ